MRKMRFGSKLVIVFMVALVPLLFIVWELISRMSTDVEITRTEVEGVVVVEKVTSLINQIQLHRGLTNLLLLGDPSVTNTREQTRNALTERIKELRDTLDRTRRIEAPPEWKELNARLESLQRNLEGKDSKESFSLHSTLVEDLTRFVYGVADKSGLLYDPDPMTYLLMDMSVSRLIPLREQVGRLRGIGAGYLNSPALNDDLVGRVHLFADALSASAKDVAYSQQILERVGFNVASGSEAQAAIAIFVKLTKERFLVGLAGTNSASYFTSGTQAVESISRYHNAVNQKMAELLRAREASQSKSLYSLIAGSIVATIVLVYLMLSFNVSFLSDLRHVQRFMEETASGNLRHKVLIRGHDELSDMSRTMGIMVNNFAFMVASARSSSALVAHAGDVLVQSSKNLSDRTEQQAANLEQTTTSVQELACTVDENAKAAKDSDRTAQQVRSTAEQGAAEMSRAIQSIEAIEASTGRMDEIVGVIDSLAFQTNILALNAAVEAARAGDSGRGFAVVAAEVRSLAQRSAASAKEIRQLISTSSAQVASGVQQIHTAAKDISKIADGVRVVASNMSLISASSVEQSTGLSEISIAIRHLDAITQQNATMVEQAVHQASALQERAKLLADAVSVFKLQQGSADEARHLVNRALELRQDCSSLDTFVREVTAEHSSLFDRDMYVFVLSRNGQYLGFAGNPDKVGTRVQDVAGINGNELMNSIIKQADVGPGWVEYEISNPLTGQVQTKMSYVMKVDDAYLGCGVYKSLMATN